MSQGDMFNPPPASRFPKTRPFQDHSITELRAGHREHRKQILMAPTGAGKTIIALLVAQSTLARGKRVLFICDRKTLIRQTSERADSYGMPTHGIIQADNPRMALYRPFQIASAQTIQARGISDDFDVVIVDECHTRMKAVEKFIEATSAYVIGLSATPFTKGLGTVYTRLINAATMDELTKQGFLVPLRVLSCARPDMAGAKKSPGGEWTPREAEVRGMGIIGDVVTEWSKHAFGLKTIVFGATIIHCEELVRQFVAIGVKAATFTADTSDADRKVLLDEYNKPDSKIRVLVSVDALAKGFDVPDVGCVVDCRPLRKSLSTFIQMIGRGLRCSVETGKTECLLLDHSGNIIRFADDFGDVYFNGLASLDAGEKLDKDSREDAEYEPKSCASCGYTPCGRRCVQCGFEPIRKSLIEHDPGVAREIAILGDAHRYANSRLELFAAIATYEKGRAARRGKGNPKGATAHRYRELTGKWPPGSFDFESTPFTVPSPTLQGKLRSLEIAFAKRMGR